MKNVLINILTTLSLLILSGTSFADSTDNPSNSQQAMQANIALGRGIVTATFFLQTNSYMATGGTGPTWDLRVTQCPPGTAQIAGPAGGADPQLTSATGQDKYGKNYDLFKCLCQTRDQNSCPTGVYTTGNLGYTSYVQCKATTSIENFYPATTFQNAVGGKGAVPDITGNNIYLYCAGPYGQAAGCNNVANPPGATPKSITGYTPAINTYAVPYTRCNP
ncbi:MAG: hypothetical protein ABI597_07140 [Gammaproteobacteria bacterium]